MQTPMERWGLTGRPDIRWNEPHQAVALVLLDWIDHTGRAATTVAKLGADGALNGCRDVSAGDSHDGILRAWIAHAGVEGLPVDDRRTFEAVHLVDGAADQALVPGVAPVPAGARQLAAHRARREARRGDAPLPSGGLFDETARAQQELF